MVCINNFPGANESIVYPMGAEYTEYGGVAAFHRCRAEVVVVEAASSL